MKSVKRFLLAFVAVYVVIGIGVNVLYGPPGFSSEFLEEYRSETDRYLEIVKSDAFKLWEENPEANPPGSELERQIAFVEEFRSNPAFRAELDRRERYRTISDWFNVIMLTVLVVVLARGPIARFVAGMVASERQRIEGVERKRSAAARRKAEAERKIELLEVERAKAAEQAAARIADEIREVESSTEEALRQLRQETEDRQRNAELQAQRRMKSMLADEAIAILTERYRSERSPEKTEMQIDQFLHDLGELR